MKEKRKKYKKMYIKFLTGCADFTKLPSGIDWNR